MPKKVLLFVYSNSDKRHLPHLKEEEKMVRLALREIHKEEDFLLEVLSNPSVDELLDYLNSHIKDIVLFNYSGHADSNSLLIDDNLSDASGLGRILVNAKQLKLVVLNGCSTAAQVDLMIQLKVPIIVATTCPVSDRSASLFARHFYQFLADGKGNIPAAGIHAFAATLLAANQPEEEVRRIGGKQKTTHQYRNKWAVYYAPTGNQKYETIRLNQQMDAEQLADSSHFTNFLIVTKQLEKSSLLGKIPAHKQFECDRLEQMKYWRKLFRIGTEKAIEIAPFNFYYLHGHYREEHNGFLRRLENQLTGLIETSCRRADPELGKNWKPKHEFVEIQFPDLAEKPLYEEVEEEFLSELIQALKLGMNANLAEIKTKGIARIKEQSAKLNALKANDFCILHISIKEENWDQKMVHQLITWLIEELFYQGDFHEGKRIEQGTKLPRFFLFFSIIYQEKARPLSLRFFPRFSLFATQKQIQKEVALLLATAKYVKPFPQLESVPHQFPKRWCDANLPKKNAQGIGLSTNEIDQLKQEFFDKLYRRYPKAIPMADVQGSLAKLIEHINAKEIYDFRH